MRVLRYTLVTDGSSDGVLLGILDWLLEDLLEGQAADVAIQGEWADLCRITTRNLSEKIAKAIDLYPCELLFIHRDAENQSPQERVREIRKAAESLNQEAARHPVPIIPVRMTEAWLLISEPALRSAALNPNGKVPLQMPSLQALESLPDPKQILHDLLRQASELNGRRLKNFRTNLRVRDIPPNIKDFTPLRQLSSFQALEADLQAWLKRWLDWRE
jgi:hypothetical protein